MNLLLKILWKLHERYNYLLITVYLQKLLNFHILYILDRGWRGKFKLSKRVVEQNKMNLLLKILWKLHDHYNYLQITN
jgi:hypothetical protein